MGGKLRPDVDDGIHSFFPGESRSSLADPPLHLLLNLDLRDSRAQHAFDRWKICSVAAIADWMPLTSSGICAAAPRRPVPQLM